MSFYTESGVCKDQEGVIISVLKASCGRVNHSIARSDAFLFVSVNHMSLDSVPIVTLML